MDKFTDHLGTDVTRRQVVKTGVKLAYAAPLVAASFRLTAGSTAAADLWVPIITEAEWLESEGIVGGFDKPDDKGPKDCKTVICHRTCSESGGELKNGFNAIEIPRQCTVTPEAALAAHLEQHPHTCQGGRQDFIAIGVNDKKEANCGTTSTT